MISIKISNSFFRSLAQLNEKKYFNWNFYLETFKLKVYNPDQEMNLAIFNVGNPLLQTIS